MVSFFYSFSICFLSNELLFLFSHLFAGSQEADINVSPVLLQQLHNLQDEDRAIEVVNVVHQRHCQQTNLQNTED